MAWEQELSVLEGVISPSNSSPPAREMALPVDIWMQLFCWLLCEVRRYILSNGVKCVPVPAARSWLFITVCLDFHTAIKSRSFCLHQGYRITYIAITYLNAPFLFCSQGVRVHTFQGHVHPCNHATFNKKVRSANFLFLFPLTIMFLTLPHTVLLLGDTETSVAGFRISGGPKWPHLPARPEPQCLLQQSCPLLAAPSFLLWAVHDVSAILLSLLGSLITLIKWNFC